MGIPLTTLWILVLRKQVVRSYLGGSLIDQLTRNAYYILSLVIRAVEHVEI